MWQGEYLFLAFTSADDILTLPSHPTINWALTWSIVYIPKAFLSSTLVFPIIYQLDDLMQRQEPLYLVTGGYGFIGCYVVNDLLRRGCRVRVADKAEFPSYPISGSFDFRHGDLCDAGFCRLIVDQVSVVIHLAANMGGMGTIHPANDFIIYRDNHLMTHNLVKALLSSSTPSIRFFYASSACVYPDNLQGPDQDVQLRESDAGRGAPQGLYGLEKLHAEWFLRRTATEFSHFELRIARFHNIFGPGGAWANGREKAPAALLRKTHAIRRFGPPLRALEIWGDGSQRRSFLFIEDAVRAIWSLLNAEYSEPINIGSDHSVSIRDLGFIAAECAGLSKDGLVMEFRPNKPVGVGSRNANLDFIHQALDWSSEISLFDGMQRTSTWISNQIDQHVNTENSKEVLENYLSSEVVELSHAEPTIIAILLPITSRGTSSPEDCLQNLKRFAQSLSQTTRRDVQTQGFEIRIYLAIDHDDDFLLPSSDDVHRSKDVLASFNFEHIRTNVCHFPRGHVCSLWRTVARRAYNEQCDLFLLAGDDVVFTDEDWLSSAIATFTLIAETRLLPPGVGCVAFTDETFPGMPTFPIIHRTHFDIFDGEVVPEDFINQDGDPYLFQLYRHWGGSVMIEKRLQNINGGEQQARYDKMHTNGWTCSPLKSGVERVRRYLKEQGSLAQELLTLDVVVPSYRVDLTLLKGIINLKPSPTCSPMFIIIIDDPTSSSCTELQKIYGARSDIRIRKNTRNLGASASRNRGLFESAADWVHFLDDDVVPDPLLLEGIEAAIRAAPEAAGFVGLTRFPPATTVFTSAVHLAGVTYFWSIANQPSFKKDVPWGVTANLTVKRVINNVVVEYDLAYPKTGGGEDIDYCRQQRALSKANKGTAFHAAPSIAATHPWWNRGRRSYWRFYGWAKGDSRLVGRYPELTYLDVPNAAESLLLASSFTICRLIWAIKRRDLRAASLGLRAIFATLAANVVHDAYRHLWRDRERTRSIDSTVGGPMWVLAVGESSLIRIWSEVGRTVGILQRGEVGYLFHRFDWFCGEAGKGPRNEERKNNLQRLSLIITLLSAWHFVRCRY